MEMNVTREGKTLIFSTPQGVELSRIRCKSADKAEEKLCELLAKPAVAPPEQEAEPTTFDFEDSNGPVPAHRHRNLNGSLGGWVADTATVEPTVYVGPNAWVYGSAEVFGSVHVCGNARVYGDAFLDGNVWVCGNARVYGDAEVCGNAQVHEDAEVCGNAEVFGNTVLTSGTHT
jgi:hypothetical protein